MSDNSTAAAAAIDFIRLLFRDTEHPVYFSSLANDRDEPGQPGERNVSTREPDNVERFVAKWDRRGRGLFYCVATIEGGRRSKEAAREIAFLWSDIDYKGVDPGQDVTTGIARLRHPPSLIVASGHGAHLYYLLKEPLDAQAGQPRIEAALRQLADMVAGDLAVCEVARLMRLPGTHNTKGGEWIPVTAIQTREEPYRYTIEELEDWLAEAAPVLRRRTGIKSAGIDARAADDNPWLQAARDMGYKPRVDVAARLEGMTYGGAGEAGIHATQLSVSAALLNAGQDIEEAVALLLEATARAAGDLGSRWDWRKEEAALRKMCVTWLEKHPPTPKTKPEPEPAARASMGQDANTGDETVIDFGTARARRKAKAGKPPNQHRIVAETFLQMLGERGDAVMFTQKNAYRYPDRLWRLEMDEDIKTWLEVEMERVAQRIELESTNRLISEARNYILRNPALYRENVLFDAHGQVPCRSGLVNPLTGVVTPPAKEHFATWRIDCDYVPAATCPWWLRMLDDVFADRAPEQRAEVVALLQEILGAGLIDHKPRDLSRALVLQGGSNAGKSGLLEVMGGLFGGEVNTTALETLDKYPHALMPFAYRVPWVLHEAFDAGKWHFSAIVKAIITGEPVQINMKGGRIFTTRITAPILWGTNSPPQFREATKAITNRIAVVECRREFDAAAPVGAAAEALRTGFHRPARMVLETELEGVFAWAVEGLRRALARGSFVLPQDTQDAAHTIRRDSNIAAGFIEDCCEHDPDGMVSTPDFWAAFGSWWMENKDGDRRIPSGDRVGTAIRALADPLIVADRKELRDKKRRYYAGFHLNEAGVAHWENGLKAEAFEMKGRLGNVTDAGGNPNSVVPEEWYTRQSVRNMREAHRRKGDRGDRSSESGHRERSFDQRPDPTGKSPFGDR